MSIRDMIQKKIEEYRARAKAYFEAKIPAHIINARNDWINGFIMSQPNETFFIVLDRKDGPRRIPYVDIAKFTEFTGPISTLPVPKSMEGVL